MCVSYDIYIKSNIHAPVLLYILNLLRKCDKMLGKPHFLFLFHNSFNISCKVLYVLFQTMEYRCRLRSTHTPVTAQKVSDNQINCDLFVFFQTIEYRCRLSSTSASVTAQKVGDNQIKCDLFVRNLFLDKTLTAFIT